MHQQAGLPSHGSHQERRLKPHLDAVPPPGPRPTAVPSQSRDLGFYKLPLIPRCNAVRRFFFSARRCGAIQDLVPVRPRATSSALDPDRMSTDERLREVGEILTSGLIRLRARRREQQAADTGDVSLDFTARQSVHGRTPRGRRKSHA